MRWNCPHCSVGLNVPDEQLGEGWCFSKCYQCSGFSLVRRSDAGAVRVDGNVTTPSAGLGSSILTESPWRVSQKTLEAAKPVIRPSRKVTAGPTAVQQVAREMEKAKVLPPPFAGSQGLISKPLPPPLPERKTADGNRTGRRIYKMVTRTLALGVLGAVAVGVYTWVTTPMPVDRDSMKTAQSKPVVPSAQTQAIQAPSLVSDSIASGAMAPDRSPENVVSEQIRQTGLEVEALSPRVQLRAGPGLDHEVVGVFQPGKTFAVVDWSERWFRIAVENRADGTAQSFAWVRNDLVKLVKKSR